MTEQRLTEADVERVSNRVAGKLLRYAVIGFVVFFVILPLLGMFILYAYRGSSP